MTDVPLGFSFEQTGDGFTLRNNVDGEVTEIKVPADQVLGLKAEIDLWSSRRLLSLQVEGGAVQPIEVRWIAKVGVWPDQLRNVVLFAQGSSGGETKLAFPLHVAIHLAAHLSGLVKELVAESPTKQ